LPTCTVKELRTVFGPVATFCAEGEDPATLLQFTFDGRKLVQKIIQLATLTAPLAE